VPRGGARTCDQYISGSVIIPSLCCLFSIVITRLKYFLEQKIFARRRDVKWERLMLLTARIKERNIQDFNIKAESCRKDVFITRVYSMRLRPTRSG